MKKKIIFGVIGLVLICIVSAVLFVSWANQPENVQAALDQRTADANLAVTQAAQSTQAAAATAAANVTATAVMEGIDKRLSSASLVFEENFDEGSLFIEKNIGDLSLSTEDNMPKISLGFPGFRLWQVDKKLGDFAAELDCEAAGEGTYCGIAYGIHKYDSNIDRFYASYISSGGYCGFDDLTSSVSSSKGWYCSPPSSPAAGFLSRLRVERFGTNLRFYVNGQLMDERVLTSEDALVGGVGVYIGRQGSDNSGVFYTRLDHFSVWELP